MKLTHIITVDTRENWLGPKSVIGEYGNANLCGCRSLDFFTDATIARNRFLESPMVTERRTVLCIDVHEPIPDEVHRQLDALLAAGEITSIVETPHTKELSRWGDRIYIRALARAGDADLVAKWDGDCIGYRREGFDALGMMVGLIDAGEAYVCQQSPLTKEEHKMLHSSTRFFLTRRATMDLPEAERLLDARPRAERFGGRHLPCLEHILGAMSGDRVVYPQAQYEDFVIWSWVHYFAGTIAKLNAKSYDDVKRIVFDEWGGPLGAADVIGKEIA